jgi:hypothetical protein
MEQGGRGQDTSFLLSSNFLLLSHWPQSTGRYPARDPGCTVHGSRVIGTQSRAGRRGNYILLRLTEPRCTQRNIYRLECTYLKEESKKCKGMIAHPKILEKCNKARKKNIKYKTCNKQYTKQNNSRKKEKNDRLKERRYV